MTAARPPAKLPDWLVLNRNFVLLWAAYGVSAFGDNFNDTGQLSLMDALESDQSVRLMALMMFGLFLPYVILGPLAGWCADRMNRRGIMIFADLTRAAIVANFVIVIPWLRDLGCGAYTVMFSQMSLGMLAVFFSPSRQALVPALVRSDQLVRANALIGALAPICAMVGFLAGGYVVDTTGVTWTFRINALTYLLSAACVFAIRPPRGQHTLAASNSIMAPLLEGFAYVRTHRHVLQLILLGALFWGAAGVVYSCIPAIVKGLGSTQYADVGNYRALTAAGMILGAGFMSVVGARIGIRTAIVAGLALAGASLVLVAAAILLHWPAAFIVAGLLSTGIGGSLLLVTVNASLQRFVPDLRRGRVFGVSDMVTTGAMVLATGVIGLPDIPKLDLYTPWLLIATAVGMFIALLFAANGGVRHRA